MRDIDAERREIDSAIEGRTIGSLFEEVAKRFPEHPVVRWREGDEWRELTATKYREQVRDVTLGLLGRGFEPGHFGLIQAANRPEHVIADLGICHARGVSVSVYNTLAPDQIAYIADHCGARVAFLENETYLERYRGIRDQLPNLELVVLMTGEASDDGWVITWDELVAEGRAAAAADPSAFDRSWQEAQPEDLLSVIYTSGTTGPPKGVAYSHRNIIWTAASSRRRFGAEPLTDGKLLSFLPLAHVAERFTSHWAPLWWMVELDSGISVSFCPDLAQLLVYLIDVRPTLFVGVPRLWEKFAAAIKMGIAAEPDEQRKAGIEQAVAAGRRFAELAYSGEEVPADVAAAAEASRPVHSAILGKLGLDECRIAITSTAPTPVDIQYFFAGLGLDLCEVWGMSELTGPATAVPRERIRIGTVGPTIPGVEGKLGEDGELLIRGGNVMLGYYKSPEQTAETIDADGWLHSGDIATVDDDGYYRIVDRKKELIITSSGKNISPAHLESLLKLHPLVGQAIAIGDNRNYVTALIVLDPEVTPMWAASNGLAGKSLAELAEDETVIGAIRQGVEQANSHLARIEQVKRFTILKEEWTPESGELTPTQKLKRRVINERYGDRVDAMYADQPQGHEVVAKGADRE